MLIMQNISNYTSALPDSTEWNRLHPWETCIIAMGLVMYFYSFMSEAGRDSPLQLMLANMEFNRTLLMSYLPCLLPWQQADVSLPWQCWQVEPGWGNPLALPPSPSLTPPGRWCVWRRFWSWMWAGYLRMHDVCLVSGRYDDVHYNTSHYLTSTTFMLSGLK